MSIEFILDGKKVTANAGETILEVAKKNSISIPTLCRDERISKLPVALSALLSEM